MLISYVYFTHSSYSHQKDTDTNFYKLELGDSRNVLYYKFGISNMVTIHITDRDSLCDVAIYDEDGFYLSTTHDKAPILRWAFSDMADKIRSLSKVIDDNYKPFFYEISIIQDSSQLKLASNERIIDEDELFKLKIEELKTFLINLWLFNCDKVVKQPNETIDNSFFLTSEVTY